MTQHCAANLYPVPINEYLMPINDVDTEAQVETSVT